MPRFEVFFPAAPPGQPLDLTLRVDAASWLAALKHGLEKVGAADRATHVLCDVRPDGSIHVTDPRGDRVFRIRELSDAAAFEASYAAAPAVRTPFGGAAAPAAPARAAPAAPPAPAARPPARVARRPEEILADVDARAAALRGLDPADALGALLDLALEQAGCEAGTVFLASPASDELEFAVIRGPSADAIARLGARVPVGAGIVGFCARENVAVAVADARTDPRHDRALAEAVGYEARSVLCAPVAAGGRVLGAIELLNKRGGAFDPTDLAVLRRVAREAAAVLGA